MFALTLPFRLPNFCSAIRATLGQRQIRQSPGLALNAHSGNEWGKIPVLTGFPSPSILWCFPFALICHWISIVFLFYGRRITTHSVDPPLTHFLGQFPGLGLALVPDVVVPQAEQRCTWSRKLDPNFCPGWGRTSGPWHLAAAGVATRLSRTSPYIYIYINIYIYIQRRGLLICRAHSFPRPAEFRAEPRNLGSLPRNWATEFVFSPRNLTFFIRTPIFSQKKTSK